MSRIRTYRRLAFVVTSLVALAACNEVTTQPRVSPDASASRARSGISDPTATWIIPTADATLNVRGDGMYTDGGANSVYANGVCGLSTTIFATTAASNSGDATINSGTSGKCSRKFLLVYPDGSPMETVRSFNNLRGLQNTTDSIAVGDSTLRRFVVNPATLSNNPSHCGTLYFGPGPSGDQGAGSDSVWVKRVDASSWHVHSQAVDDQGTPHNLALCVNTNTVLSMQVDFTIVASRPLP
jgi:hypothetical protein